MKTILIFGGHGFLGTNLNDCFRSSDDYKIINASRRTGCDLTDYESVLKTIAKHDPDIIIHCAANVGSVHYVSTYAADVIHDNVLMCLNLYRAISEFNKDIIVVNPLANCSYPGDANIQIEDQWWNGKVHESVESFGVSKKTVYIVSECYKKQYGIKTINIMLGGGFGEHDHIDETRTHAMNGIIMRMLRAKKNNDETFTIWGSGAPIREWVYMPDVARLIKEILDNKLYDLPNPINVGQANGVSIRELADVVKKQINYTGKIVCDLSVQDGAPVKVLSADLFRKHFPNFRFTDLETGIKNTIEYFIKKDI